MAAALAGIATRSCAQSTGPPFARTAWVNPSLAAVTGIDSAVFATFGSVLAAYLGG